MRLYVLEDIRDADTAMVRGVFTSLEKAQAASSQKDWAGPFQERYWEATDWAIEAFEANQLATSA